MNQQWWYCDLTNLVSCQSRVNGKQAKPFIKYNNTSASGDVPYDTKFSRAILKQWWEQLIWKSPKYPKHYKIGP